MLKRFLHLLGKGGPLSPIWPGYVCFGGILIGFFSIPSTGGAVVLIPMFLSSGFVIGLGMYFHYVGNNRQRGYTLIQSGLVLMLLASWTRGISLWGIVQHGVGSNFIATAVWGWISLGCLLLFVSIWLRGLD